jgi:RND family efflux transporter MFP subunit
VLGQEGQAVKEGEIIARLDDTNVRAALEQFKAQVRKPESAVTATRRASAIALPTFARSEKQLRNGLRSQDAFDTSKATYDSLTSAMAVAAKNLVVARATVEVNRRFADDTNIRAPFDGVGTVKNAQPGEIVSPQFSGGGGIVDMNSLEVDADVSENLIHRVHSHQPATITLNAYSDWKIPSRLIALILSADRAKATVKVRIGFESKDPRVVPAMGAHVSF